ncbi:hypothetical protein niasHT_004631 [Heterodera trifolii]|uniref:Uncharacterized protein n=1 Tax=Heterodera trifolii TaxID=157864 RepID=A0ABD2MAN4_9BILA
MRRIWLKRTNEEDLFGERGKLGGGRLVTVGSISWQIASAQEKGKKRDPKFMALSAPNFAAGNSLGKSEFCAKFNETVVGTERTDEVKWSRMSMDGQEEQHQQKHQQRNSLTHSPPGTNQLSIIHKFIAGERLETEIGKDTKIAGEKEEIIKEKGRIIKSKP